MIILENIHQSYGNKEVLKNISLTIPEGKITGIIGPNGAGKTTLFNVISRVIQSKSGKIQIDGVDILDSKMNLSKQIAVLKQANHFNLKLTSYELISFGRYPHSKGKITKEDKKMIDQMISYLSLEEIKDQHIDTLSGGQLQRVLLAMVLVQDTKYIMLDEPLNNLDMKHGVEMMLLLQKFVDELGKTIVVVMHDINIASTFCEHVVAIKDGEIYFEGPSENLMVEKTLNSIYDSNFCIREVDGKRICIYHKNEVIFNEGESEKI
ncbi:ABC transporter ATP-binding protein [Acholeplasma laidlawii]|uniref:ABC-type transport system, ATPase component n=2 Tax=Acholeplasma laidlawii TaxID=2148 RepID=A9NGT6_ACHLI|nr:ATP-binding cassette domain-containing protein [Acholeplasma laidlawii]ABX81566.1 ABC-type transport system, ATPase component [Acholeplasma laidlawii PG-8A]NWH11248.1 ATP-binding cassette domain-containing protein [Acholeplasma laidlawii]NWH13342.1 ATP-binding cassette domain-containing protein [Acholeplasma laidlawii]NWH14110.1 ATP-binding cassette domain-containing protein [Acholeplasma laidlawii]OAN20353.1 iron ABC transporter ATP-binding protein [Acholeplasma laidlawii]